MNDYSNYEKAANQRRLIGFTAVVLLHLFLGYALVTGLARDALNIVKKPLEAKIIDEIKPPPPPPPPPPKEIKQPDMPKVQAPPPPFVPPPEIAPPATNAQSITATSNEAPPAEYKIAAPPPPAAAPGPARTDIGVACPTQTKPELPRKALQDGVGGIVRAEALIVDGVVKEVTILSGPRVFHAAVRAAMLQYKCASGTGEVRATQEFVFKIE
jgi:protein TonB